MQEERILHHIQTLIAQHTKRGFFTKEVSGVLKNASIDVKGLALSLYKYARYEYQKTKKERE